MTQFDSLPPALSLSPHALSKVPAVTQGDSGALFAQVWSSQGQPVAAPQMPLFPAVGPPQPEDVQGDADIKDPEKSSVTPEQDTPAPTAARTVDIPNIDPSMPTVPDAEIPELAPKTPAPEESLNQRNVPALQEDGSLPERAHPLEIQVVGTLTKDDRPNSGTQAALDASVPAQRKGATAIQGEPKSEPASPVADRGRMPASGKADPIGQRTIPDSGQPRLSTITPGQSTSPQMATAMNGGISAERNGAIAGNQSTEDIAPQTITLNSRQPATADDAPRARLQARGTPTYPLSQNMRPVAEHKAERAVQGGGETATTRSVDVVRTVTTGNPQPPSRDLMRSEAATPTVPWSSPAARGFSVPADVSFGPPPAVHPRQPEIDAPRSSVQTGQVKSAIVAPATATDIDAKSTAEGVTPDIPRRSSGASMVSETKQDQQSVVSTYQQAGTLPSDPNAGPTQVASDGKIPAAAPMHPSDRPVRQMMRTPPSPPASPLPTVVPLATLSPLLDANSQADIPLDPDVALVPTPQPQTAQQIAPTAALNRAYAPHVTQQITAAIVQSSGGTTEIMLNPEELGRVRIAMTAGDAGLTVTLLAERPETIDLMRRNIEHLTRELRDMGYDNPTFNFENQHRGTGEAWGENTPQSDASAELPVIEAPTITRQHVTLSGGLDLKL